MSTVDHPSPATAWLAAAQTDVTRDPGTVTRAFAVAGRAVGRAPLRPRTDPTGVVHGTLDDAARAELVVTLVDSTEPHDAADHLDVLYRQGDTAERRGALRGLDALAVRWSGPGPGLAAPLVRTGVALAEDALRSNDPSLVASALGAFGARHLDDHTWRHGVIKLVFLGVSLEAVHDLPRRTDAELARMAHDLAAERRAAGRAVPDDLDRLTQPAPATTEE